MSDTMTQTSATQTSPSSKDFAPCAGKCRWNIRVGTGFVPNVRRAYWEVRKSDIRKAFPLTRAELLALEMCQGCAKRAGFEVVPTAEMLDTMQAWAFENNQRKEEALIRNESFQERQRARALEMAIKREDKSPINRLLATRKIEEKPRPKKRTHHHVAASSHTGPKKFGDERKLSTDEPKRRKKGKQGGDDNKKKGKGR
jgi:hypothetical protein